MKFKFLWVLCFVFCVCFLSFGLSSTINAATLDEKCENIGMTTEIYNHIKKVAKGYANIGAPYYLIFMNEDIDSVGVSNKPDWITFYFFSEIPTIYSGRYSSTNYLMIGCNKGVKYYSVTKPSIDGIIDGVLIPSSSNSLNTWNYVLNTDSQSIYKLSSNKTDTYTHRILFNNFIITDPNGHITDVSLNDFSTFEDTGEASPGGEDTDTGGILESIKNAISSIVNTLNSVGTWLSDFFSAFSDVLVSDLKSIFIPEFDDDFVNRVFDTSIYDSYPIIGQVVDIFKKFNDKSNYPNNIDVGSDGHYHNDGLGHYRKYEQFNFTLPSKFAGEDNKFKLLNLDVLNQSKDPSNASNVLDIVHNIIAAFCWLAYFMLWKKRIPEIIDSFRW